DEAEPGGCSIAAVARRDAEIAEDEGVVGVAGGGLLACDGELIAERRQAGVGQTSSRGIFRGTGDRSGCIPVIAPTAAARLADNARAVGVVETFVHVERRAGARGPAASNQGCTCGSADNRDKHRMHEHGLSPVYSISQVEDKLNCCCMSYADVVEN